jgi:hypothetical protein
MDNNSNNMVPKLIRLEGGKNLQIWDGMLKQILRYYGLVDYILKASTQIHKTTRSQAAIVGMIMESVLPVMDQLAKAGWDLGKVEQDPKDVYDLIMRTFTHQPPALAIMVGAHRIDTTKPPQLAPNKKPSEAKKKVHSGVEDMSKLKLLATERGDGQKDSDRIAFMRWYTDSYMAAKQAAKHPGLTGRRPGSDSDEPML